MPESYEKSPWDVEFSFPWEWALHSWYSFLLLNEVDGLGAKIYYLIFTQQGQVEDDLKGFSVGSKDDELRDTSVEGLGGFVGTLLDL